jgi:hypothetical protein
MFVGDGDVVVDEAADRLRAARDALFVGLHQRRDLLRRAEGEAQRAEAELAGLGERRRAGAGEPHRRIRLGVRLREHVALGHAEILARYE